MHRRPFLAALGSAALATTHGQTAMATDNDPLDDIKLVKHDHDWIDRQLRAHYGDGWGSAQPLDGIFWHSPDSVDGARLPASRRPLLHRARVLCELPEPGYELDAYDCEDYALRLFIALKMAHPRLRVGVVYNFSGGHAYNLFVTGSGDVIEFEPLDGSVVTDSEHEHYQVTDGIVMF